MRTEQPQSDSGQTLTLTRGILRDCNRTTREGPPLARGNVSDSGESDVIEIPVPLSVAEDSQDVRILHVDDNPDMGEVTKLFLERIDDSFSVTSAENAVEAFDLLKDNQFECVISDYDMPNTNGIEFLEVVREQYPDLPFILFTGKGSEEVASEAIAAGVTDYMQKGVGSDQYEILANRVQNAVEQYRTQKKFWDALSWYQRLVEQELTGVCIIQDDELVYVNERFADIFGYTQSELVGTSPSSLASESEDENTVQNVLQCSGETFQHEFVGQRKDGTEFSVEIHGGSIQYDGDSGCIGILWKQSEEASNQ